jgi:4-oxalocrotonate tautomerase
MPLVRIDLREGKPEHYKAALANAVHQAMMETINISSQDRFVIISEHPAASLVYDPHYLNISRTDDIVVVQITLNAGRTVEIKKALYARVIALLGQDPGIRPQDVLINLVEVSKENWSFGNGEAQYAPG